MIDPMITRRCHFTHQFANFFNFAFHHATLVLTFHIVITFIAKRFDFLYQSYFIKSFIRVRAPKIEWNPVGKAISRIMIPRNSKQNILELLTKMSNASLIPMNEFSHETPISNLLLYFSCITACHTVTKSMWHWCLTVAIRRSTTPCHTAWQCSAKDLKTVE